jgi:molybdopterin-guanine dinucleotide biosynthesis protein A
MTTNKISCILLTGGQSKRMGEDKAFLKLDGQTFLKIIVKKLYEKCDEIILSINKDEEIYQKELNEFLDKITFIKDKNPYDGPLNAVASVSDSINNLYVFIATVDTPLLNPELIDFYKEKISDYDCILPVINGKYQPLNTLYKKDTLEKAKEVYKSSKSLMSWINKLNCLKLYEDEISKIDKSLFSYWSINTKDEYEKLKNIK